MRGRFVPAQHPDSLRLRPLGALSLSKELWGSCMWYVFHGEDEFSRSEAIRQLKQKMDPVVGELNTSELDGRGLGVAELRAACDTLPFMGGVRLVLVSDLATSLTPAKPGRQKRASAAGEGLWQELGEYLPHIPESTRLVLSESKALPARHPLLRLAEQCGAYVRAFDVPTSGDLEQWIRRRAEAKGVGIAPDALALLAMYIGANLRLLDQELEKLATYLGGTGTIGRSDVERLVSSVQEANIFHMVDALGHRNGRRALQLLHRLLDEGKAPLYLLTMITRQFRLLLQARELDAQGATQAEMAQQMQTHPFVARKCLQQALNYRPDDLRAIMGQLLDIDVGIKTGRVDGPLALDLFIVRWASR